jgi:hypothetical protein
MISARLTYDGGHFLRRYEQSPAAIRAAAKAEGTKPQCHYWDKHSEVGMEIDPEEEDTV